MTHTILVHFVGKSATHTNTIFNVGEHNLQCVCKVYFDYWLILDSYLLVNKM